MARLDPNGERWLQYLDQMEWRASVDAEACKMLQQAARRWPGFAENRHRIAVLMHERPLLTLREAYLLAVREA